MEEGMTDNLVERSHIADYSPYELVIRRRALEEAARMAEKHLDETCADIAAAIRAMKL
jgi:hypothetical protein